MGCEMSCDTYNDWPQECATRNVIRRLHVRYGVEVRERSRERDGLRCETILAFLQGRDVFVSLPTGSGKSLCYSTLLKVFDTLKKKNATSIAIVVGSLKVGFDFGKFFQVGIQMSVYAC